MSELIALELSSPTAIDFVITSQCNHHCLHCYNPWRATNKPGYNSNLEKSLYEHVDLIISKLIEHDIWSVTITGGEPLTNPKLLFYIIESLNSSNIAYGLNSNLSLMTEEIAKKLIELDFKSLILTSLPAVSADICDYITQNKDSHTNIMRGIEICLRHDIDVGINMVVTKRNISDLAKLTYFVKDNKISYVSISSVIPPSYDLNNLDYHLSKNDLFHIANTLIEIKSILGIEVNSVIPFPLCILKNHEKYKSVLSTTCSAGISKCAIELESGNIYACTHEEIPYGNIYDNGLMDAWQNMKSWRNSDKLNPNCLKCDYLAICGGECRMLSKCKYVDYSLIPNIEIEIAPPQFPVITERDEFVLSKKLVLREEVFGAVIHTNFEEKYITKPIVQLIEVLTRIGTFSISELEEYVSIDDNLINALQQLEYMGIIIRTRTTCEA